MLEIKPEVQYFILSSYASFLPYLKSALNYPDHEIDQNTPQYSSSHMSMPPPSGNLGSLFKSTCFWQSAEALPDSVQGQNTVGTFILDTKGSVCTASMFWNNQKVRGRRENSRIRLMAKDNSKEKNQKTPKMIQKAAKVPKLQTDRGWKHTQGKYHLLFLFLCFLLATIRDMIQARETFDMMQ